MEVDSNGGDNPLVNEGEQVESDFRPPRKQVEEPKKGMCFSSREEVYTFYATYAKHVGFSIAHRAQYFGDDGELKNFAIECSRAGERKKKSEVNPLKPSLSTKIGCKARRRLEINDQAGIGVSRNYHSMVVETGGYESLTFDERDARNYTNRARRLRLGEGDAESLQSYFIKMQAHSEKFFYARHRWCLWHVMKKIPEKLKGYAQYEPMKLAMQNAIYDCLTRDEFEEKWEEMLTKFNLYDNEWLGVLYHERHRWVPVLSVNHSSPSTIAFCGGEKKEIRSEPFEAMFVHKNWLQSKGTGYSTKEWDIYRRLEINDEAGIGVSRNYHSMVVEAGGYESLTFDERDARNYINRARRLRLGEGDAESLPSYFIKMQAHSEKFFYAQHRWCLWHVMKKIPEKLKGYAQYEPMKLAMQNAIYDCLTRDEFEEKWEEMLTKFNLYDNEWLGVLYHERHRWVPQAYTNAKFKEVQGELKRLVYCQALIVKEEGAICTYNVQEAMVVCDKMKHVDFVVYFNSIECEVQCMCRLFQFRGIMCAHSLAVLVRRCINEVPSKYILPRWRKDLVREYTYIKTTYTGFGDDFNTSCYERMNKKLIAIIQLAGNSEGKIKIINCALDEMKDRVMHDKSGDGSNLAPSTNRITSSTKSPIATGCTSGASTRKVVSPLVVRRRGRPVTKRKVAKVDQIVNRFKITAKKQTKAKVVNAIGGTSLIPSNFVSGTPRSLIHGPTQFLGSGSLTPSGSNACIPGMNDGHCTARMNDGDCRNV
ncbi:uncharacterized protein LOC114262051 [Camellia sinensis]|uniref:uncharacterized protein LOC114262051 n=1 Tax=Camellia sinensis TaxID=4442 RepID=UPI001035B474|nr:uncharacterized protein LOC114262051 [Camellia sinensis]